nr:transposase [Microvirga sp. HBU67692]
MHRHASQTSLSDLRSGELWRFAKLRQVKFLNNIVEQDHRRIKRLVRPGLGFKSLTTASRMIAGYEVMAMIRDGQVAIAPAKDMKAQSDFMAALFRAAA